MIITGHEGYIGSRLFERLKILFNPVGLDIKSSKDILSCELPDADVIYHLAAQASVPMSWEDPIYDARQNILTAIKIAERYKNSKIIYTGSAASIEASCPYGLSKRTAEDYLKMIAKNLVICVLPNIFGDNKNGVVERFIVDDPIVVHGGEQTRTFVHLEDIVDALVKAKDWDNGKYYLGGSEPVSINELAEATGKKIFREEFKSGDIVNSVIRNSTPDWKPKIKVLDYINIK